MFGLINPWRATLWKDTLMEAQDKARGKVALILKLTRLGIIQLWCDLSKAVAFLALLMAAKVAFHEMHEGAKVSQSAVASDGASWSW